jgi:hypothetical protein
VLQSNPKQDGTARKMVLNKVRTVFQVCTADGSRWPCCICHARCFGAVEFGTVDVERVVNTCRRFICHSPSCNGKTSRGGLPSASALCRPGPTTWSRSMMLSITRARNLPLFPPFPTPMPPLQTPLFFLCHDLPLPFPQARSDHLVPFYDAFRHENAQPAPLRV